MQTVIVNIHLHEQRKKMENDHCKVNEAVENLSYKREIDPLNKDSYTIEDWLSWDENLRTELHEGNLIMLAQPTQSHQKVLGELHGQLWQFLKGKPCSVFTAPFGVRLFEDEDTAYEPDIVVVCDKSRLGGKTLIGAPDFVIEILSPSTARMDKLLKYRKYEKAGVREYWIVDPDASCVQTNVLKDGSYIISMYDETDKAPVTVLEGCEVNLADVFSEV